MLGAIVKEEAAEKLHGFNGEVEAIGGWARGVEDGLSVSGRSTFSLR
jgi:hypothetical protein